MSSASSTGAREASNARESLEPPQTTAQTRPQACERCWKRKQKCDRRLPACNSCSVLGVECIPRNQDFNIISELSHTSVVGYVASLKRRVADLEEESFSRKRSRTYSCRADSTLDQSSDHDNGARSRDATSVLSSQAMHPAGSNGHDNDDSSVRATMGAIGFLSRSAMAEPRDNSDDLPRKFSLAEVVSGALAIDGRDPSTAIPAPQSPGITNHLASVSQVSTLQHVRKFLEWSALLPYLDEDIFLRQCESIMASRAQPQPAQNSQSLHNFNVHMACAIGILLSPSSTHLSLLSAGLHSTAIKELPSVLRTEMALEHIHCMIMLLIYSLFNSSGGSAWHLLGLAVKTCISLGLHREPDAHSNLTISEATRRRWLFWTVYYFDRMISLVMDRPVSIQDDDISVRLPIEDGHVPVSADISSKRLPISRYLILYSQLISSIRAGRKDDVLLTYSNIIHWRDLPPNGDRHSSSNQQLSDLFHQLSCRALVHLTSSTPPTHESIGPLLGSTQDLDLDTINTSRQFVNRCYDLFTQGIFICNFIDAYDVFQAAVTFACLNWRIGRENSAGRRLAEVTEIINKSSTLVTIAASRFPALAAFQRVLLGLSTRMMDSHNAISSVRHLLLSSVPCQSPVC
ncbi:hypothetical protein CCHR01_11014 [Colletotrichum chrysophilum]|uniref:Zn(2)-C6 fungal-type domain-containing protein n=1 Tax=Colletotrichum chrysophilum TaxID=1836956 RepID=A0AAD9EFF4_9PEZI|nr:hypothetical protein CCHR01_11014 [Colletotrichum chrysophilum]